jgi:DNA primase
VWAARQARRQFLRIRIELSSRSAVGAWPLTNLRKVFWPASGLTKGDLLRYYQEVSPVLLPHLADRAMVMKRYPNGADGGFFFMKRAQNNDRTGYRSARSSIPPGM